MNFLRLHDPLMDVLFENEDIIAVDKPYGIDTHTNEAKKGNEAYVVPGLIELYEAQLGLKLHIIHRLDQTTTGVIVFGKSLESAKKYQQYFRARETKKTYVFITAAKSNQKHFKTDQVIVHKGADLEASTDFYKLENSASFEKWEARPHTGRNHQIRIHGAHVGLPLLGDVKYGGADFPFLCLHNRKIEFPNGASIESREPIYFEKLELLTDRVLAKALHEIDRRERLFPKAASSGQSFRLIHNSKENERDFTLDQSGEILNLSWYKDRWSESSQHTFSKLASVLKKPVLVRMMSAKLKDKSGKPGEFFLSNSETQKSSPSAALTPLSWATNEGELRFEMRSDTGQSLGLFTDQRLHRNWVQQNSKNKRVLNLFAYTGGYTLAAAVGGATEVTSVDTSKAALNWIRKNLELNQQSLEMHKIFNRDALQFLEQSVSKKIQYDLIVCDAPSFSRGEKGLFKLEDEIDRLLVLLLKCLTPGGELVFATHHDSLFVDDLRRKFLQAKKALGAEPGSGPCELELNSIQSSLDFELPGERVAMKSFLIRFKRP